MSAAVQDLIPWNRLTGSAKLAVVSLALQLADGFTGRFEIDAVAGGVAEIRDTRRRSAKDLQTTVAQAAGGFS